MNGRYTGNIPVTTVSRKKAAAEMQSHPNPGAEGGPVPASTAPATFCRLLEGGAQTSGLLRASSVTLPRR